MNSYNRLISIFFLVLSCLYFPAFLNAANEDLTALQEEFANDLVNGLIPLENAVARARAVGGTTEKEREEPAAVPVNTTRYDRDARILTGLRERERSLQDTRETYQMVLDNNVYLLGPHLCMTREQVVQAITERLFTGQITTQQAVAAAQRYGNLRRLQAGYIREQLAELDRELTTVQGQIRDELAVQERLRDERRRYEQSVRERLEREAGQSLQQERDRRRAAAERQQREDELRRIRAAQQRWADDDTWVRDDGERGGGGGTGRDVAEPGLGDLGHDLHNIFSGR